MSMLSFSRFIKPTAVACLSLLSSALQASAGNSGASPRTIRVMQFNVWHEGTRVKDGVDKIADVILKSGADVVAFSEVRNYKGEDWHKKLLAALAAKDPANRYQGKHVGGFVGLISRIPISSTAAVFDETGTDSGSIMAYRVECPDGRAMTVCAGHLDYKYYGLNLIRGYHGGEPGWDLIDENKDGVPDRQTDVSAILDFNRKSRRGAAVQAFLAFAGAERAAGRAVVFAVDMNEASHLDWTEKAKGFAGHYGVVLPWDNSQALAKAGLRDAWRTVYPDEVHNPGFTWPTTPFERKSTSWAGLSDERDRIDFIFASPDLRPSQAWLVGPRTSFIGEQVVPDPGGDPFLCSDLAWPSDHKAVLVELAY